jgi:hypothetical protein
MRREKFAYFFDHKTAENNSFRHYTLDLSSDPDGIVTNINLVSNSPIISSRYTSS